MLAFTRAVPRSIDRCELTHLDRTPIDYARAVEEHEQYEAALRAAECEVRRLPDAPELPDSVFVEDTAVVLDEIAIIARPGAGSRRGEVDATIAALRPLRTLAFVEAPGTLDGGDVLVAGTRIFVGATPRTNGDGARQLTSFVAPFGYQVVPVPVTNCLHLKSAVTVLPPERVLPPKGGSYESLVINRDWIDAAPFAGYELIDIDPDEPAAANVLAAGGLVICAAEYPRTCERLDRQGYRILPVPAGELAKAEGGVTCGCLLVNRLSQINHKVY
jgi:dimethylargininase